MSVRSASRGSPAAKSIRLALRTSSIVATRRASFVRWVLRCFGRGRLSSSPKLPAISLRPSMMRFQVPPRADSLNHKPIRHVNNLLLKLIDGKVADGHFVDVDASVVKTRKNKSLDQFEPTKTVEKCNCRTAPFHLP